MGIFDISKCTFAYFCCTHMLTSLSHMRPSGGLKAEIINISKDQWPFFRGHIQAMLSIGSPKCK